jgi:hypothetical protein
MAGGRAIQPLGSPGDLQGAAVLASLGSNLVTMPNVAAAIAAIKCSRIAFALA